VPLSYARLAAHPDEELYFAETETGKKLANQ
jgi:hypothetical protein